ncbi:MAG: phosphotransferase [Bradymonadaceae bacterium]|nr:phosphotransferase [Lujinxingiaceae bacterium]
MQVENMERRVRHALRGLFGSEVADLSKLDNLGGHASLRIYWRVHLPSDIGRAYPRGESSLMAMVMPQSDAAMASEEGTSSSDPTPLELPFVNVQRYLADIGMPVPAIDHVDLEQGLLFLEDLGDEMFEHAVLDAADTPEIEGLYREAIELLVRFQVNALASRMNDTDSNRCVAWARAFDRELLRWELDHYREWGLEARLGVEQIAPFRQRLDAQFDKIVAFLLDAPQTLVLRDYQSRNIMRKAGTWIMIDFQDALRGPFIYDLVALLRDSYIALEPDSVERLVAYYAACGQSAGLPWCTDEKLVHSTFHVQTLQRKLKDAGRFVFIDRVKHNPSFLPYYNPSIAYVENALRHLPEFESLHALLLEIEPAMQSTP